MKLLFDVSQAIYKTGVSDYTIELAIQLQKLLPGEVTLFAASLRRRSEFKEIFPNSKVASFPFPPSALDIVWNKLHIIPIDLLAGKNDIYHSSDWVQAPSNAKKVTTIHDMSPFLFPEEMRGNGMRDIVRTHLRRMKWVTRDCDKIICVSESTKKDFVKIFPEVEEGRVVVIHEALPARFIRKATNGETQSIKRKYGLRSYLVAVGTIQPRKNIVRLIETFLAFKKKLDFPEKLVIIGGKGWGDSPISSDPSVVFTGYLPDMDLIALLSGATSLVYPSLYEGFGLPILIAFHHGIPVVTSNISSLPEIAGNGAILVDPKSEESIAKGISSSIKEKTRLVRDGKKQLSKFSWEDAAKKTHQVYEELVS
jgi:glycosyltransferase involved in cell wall biosynthesis